jgi:hypothetical protein
MNRQLIPQFALFRPLAKSLVAALALCSFSSAQAETPSAGPVSASPGKGPAVDCRFDWPIPSQLRVRDKATKRGKESLLEYVVDLSRDPNGKDIRVQLRNFRVIELSGIDRSDPRIRQMIPQVEAVAAMVPVLRVAPDGKPLGFVDFDGTMKRVLERFGEMLPKDDLSQKQFAAVQAMIAQPAFRTMIKKQGYYFWEGWVSMWLGARGLRVGKPQEWTARLPGPFGGMHEHPGKRELVALDPEREGGVQLRARARGESSQLLEAVLQQWVGLLPEQMRERAPKKPFDKVELELEVEVWTDPRTLIPRKATYCKLAKVTGQGGAKSQTIEERHVFEIEMLGLGLGR